MLTLFNAFSLNFHFFGSEIASLNNNNLWCLFFTFGTTPISVLQFLALITRIEHEFLVVKRLEEVVTTRYLPLCQYSALLCIRFALWFDARISGRPALCRLYYCVSTLFILFRINKQHADKTRNTQDLNVNRSENEPDWRGTKLAIDFYQWPVTLWHLTTLAVRTVSSNCQNGLNADNDVCVVCVSAQDTHVWNRLLLFSFVDAKICANSKPFIPIAL